VISLGFVLHLISVGAGTAAAGTQSGGVADAAHVGGVLFGAITARLFEVSARVAAGYTE